MQMLWGGLIIVSTLAGLLWLRSGRDPLWWLIRALIVLRAALAWWRGLPRAIEQSRAEVVG